jgi:hypothetical protein
MSSHELELARALATREVRIENGRARVSVAAGSAP